MRKQLLLLGTFAAISLNGFAQNNAHPNNAQVWLQPSGEKSQAELNGYSAIKADANQWYDFTDEKANFYVVFRSQAQEKTDIVAYNFACHQASLHTAITDERIPSQEMMEKKLETGAIFKHSLNIPSAYINPKNSRSYFLTTENKDTEIFELLYFPQEFTNADHQRVQTYLSLKYGISLLENNNYVNRNGENIWNTNLNHNYNEHIFGLARIDDFGLVQKNSVNSLQPVLNVSSHDNFADEEYLLFGDNAGSLTFVENNGEEVLDRQYLYQNQGNNKNVTLSFAYDFIENFDADKIYALKVNHENVGFDTENADVYLGRISDNQLIFDQVEVDNFGLMTLTHLTNTTSTDQMEWAVFDEIALYPNPVKSGEKFQIDFGFNQPTEVDVYVYQVNGKLVSKSRLNAVTQQVFEQSVTTAGNYLVMVQAGGKLSTFKLLVK